ncbi:MAG: acyl-CoA thioesterase [Gammaproteobacteria bacterium]
MTSHTTGLPADRIPVLRVPATPAHTNLGGDIFGGWIMSQVDIAGSIPAVLRAKGRVVTVAVNSMTFLKPVMVGDILSLYAEVAEVGTSSLRVNVEVYAQRNPIEPVCMKISDAKLTYVAIDNKGRPRAVPT